MSDPIAESPTIEPPEIVTAPQREDGDLREAVEQPAKVMRIGSMIKQLLDEVRAAPLDEASRDRLAKVYETSISELAEALSPDLQDELHRLAPPFLGDGTPTDAELRIAQAQLVGWLEGLFHGIQATLFAQQIQAQRQFEDMRSRRTLEVGTGAGERTPGAYL